MTFKVSEYAWPAFAGRKPFAHQKVTTRFLLANKRAFVFNDMGCVDSETEFLSPIGWVKISQYDGQLVAQWDEFTKKIDFVAPTEYIKRPCDEFLVFNGVMTLSPEHRVVGRFNGIHGVRPAYELLRGGPVELYRTFGAPDRPGLKYSDDVLRVMVAYIADGSIRDGRMHVRLKLADKIERMRALLARSGIEYKEQAYESDGKTNFIFEPPMMTQEYGPAFYDCSEPQLRVLCDEVWRWDGRVLNDRHKCWEFSTMRKSSADFVQYAFSALGHMTSITQSSKVYKYKAKTPRTREFGDTTTVYIVRATMYEGGTEFAPRPSVQRTGDGFKYCFSVPKAFWLMRRHDKIVVTGNTGKTLAAAWACDMLLTAQKIRRVMVITPLSTMKSVWYNELFLNMPHRVVGIAHGPKDKRASIIANAAYEFVIINHDGVKIMEDEIIRQQFDVIIIDELTAFKGHSDRTKAMTRIAKSARVVWGMTGDLTPNSPLEAFYPIKIVNPDNEWIPRYYGQFRDACMVQVDEFTWVAKPEAPQIVAMCAQPAIRFTRDQCLDLPDTTYQTLEVELTQEQKDFYEKMAQAALLETESGAVTAVNAAVKLNKLLQISAGAVKNDVGDVVSIGCKPRLDELERIFKETPQKKLVVFATYRASIEMIVQEMTKRGYLVAAIHGGVAQSVRANLIDRFQRGDLQILVLQPQSSAHGITLTAASTIAWFSMIPSNEYFQQGNARIVRASQTRKTLIVMFVSTKAEKHIARILQGRMNMSEEILKLFDHKEL